jgi:hypothetical protein
LHGQYANPKFVNEYDDYPTFHLYNGSAAIDAGNPMFNAAFGETDFDGQNRVFNNLVDIGADENYNDFDQPSLSNQTNLETPRAINIYPSITCAVINCTTDEMIVCSDIEIKNVTGQVVNN